MSPFLAYNFSELIESHAVDTYTEFAEANKELLQSLPPTPQVRTVQHGARDQIPEDSDVIVAVGTIPHAALSFLYNPS